MQDNMKAPPVARIISLAVLVGSIFWCLIGLFWVAAQ